MSSLEKISENLEKLQNEVALLKINSSEVSTKSPTNEGLQNGHAHKTKEEKETNEELLEGFKKGYSSFLKLVDDPNREGLVDTPKRAALAMMYFTSGYQKSLSDLLNDAVFTESYDEIVVAKDIDVFSLCEHHMLPFIGKVTVGYIPNKKVIGVSKIAKIVEMYGRRLQIQERLTSDIAHALEKCIQPTGVAVVVQAAHLCMVMRGVEKKDAKTVTTCMIGAFKEDIATRKEFFTLTSLKMT